MCNYASCNEEKTHIITGKISAFNCTSNLIYLQVKNIPKNLNNLSNGGEREPYVKVYRQFGVLPMGLCTYKFMQLNMITASAHMQLCTVSIQNIEWKKQFSESYMSKTKAFILLTNYVFHSFQIVDA